MSKKTAASHPPMQSHRVKVTLACIVCRKKKVKCDGVQPACSRCGALGVPCEYSDPPRKRGPPKGHVEVIENRAHRIESLLGRSACPNAEDLSGKRAAEPPQPRHQPQPQPQMQAQWCSQAQSHFQSRMNTLLSLFSGAVEASVKHTGSHGTQNDFSTLDNVDACRRGVDAFFGHFNLFFPLLSRPHYLHQLLHAPHTIDPLLRHAIHVLGCHYLDGETNLMHASLERCYDILDTPRDAPLTLETVQALVILCWDACLSGEMTRCSVLRDRLKRCVQMLRLERDPEPSLGTVRMEQQRRTFWVVYVIDQWLTVCTGERVCFAENEVNDCKYPRLEDCQLHALDSKTLSWGKGYPMSEEEDELSVEYALQITSFAEMIKLARIVASASSQQTAHQLTQWLLGLPSYLEYGRPADDNPPSPVARVYHVLYYTVQIMLHQDIIVTQNDMAASICTTAANSITHIAEQMIHSKQQKYLYNIYAPSLTLAASIHLDNAMAHQFSAKVNLNRSLYALRQCHCHAVPPPLLEQTLDHFLAERCGIHFESQHAHAYPYSPSRAPQPTAPKQGHEKRRRSNEASPTPPPAKRLTVPAFVREDDPLTTDVEQMVGNPFDLQAMLHRDPDILQTLQDSWLDDPAFLSLLDSSSTTSSQSWHSPSTIPTPADSLSLSSPSSYFSPAHSPALSVNHETPFKTHDSFDDLLTLAMSEGFLTATGYPRTLI